MVRAGFPGRMGPRIRASRPFVDPRSISGLQAWYDTSDVSTITKDGSNNVSAWANKGGGLGTYPLTATTTARPTYVADDGDGKPCLSFSAANYIRNTNSNSMNEDTGFIVVYIDGADADAGGVFGHGTNLVNTTSAQLNWSIAGSTDGTTGLRMGLPLIRQRYIVLSCRRGAAYDMYYGGAANTGTIEVCENGATVKKTTHTGGSVGGGIYVSNAGVSTVMKVREVCWFNRCLSDAEMLQMENYLNNKWNVYNNFAGRRAYHPGLQRRFTKLLTTGPDKTRTLVYMNGQSNLGGRGSTAALPAAISGAIANSRIWYNPGTGYEWQTLQVGVNNQPSIAGRHGPELSFAFCYAADKGEVDIVKHFQDGTDLKTYWLPTVDKSVNLWRTGIDRVWDAMNKAGLEEGIHYDKIVGLSYQGEEDGGKDITYWGAYQVNEQQKIAAEKAKIVGGADMKYITVQVNSAAYPPGYQAVNAAKIANSTIVVNYQPPVARWGQGSYPGEGADDSVHANSEALIRIGNDCAALLGCTTQVTP